MFRSLPTLILLLFVECANECPNGCGSEEKCCGQDKCCPKTATASTGSATLAYNEEHDLDFRRHRSGGAATPRR